MRQARRRVRGKVSINETGSRGRERTGEEEEVRQVRERMRGQV